jgi:hypothetical protein
MLPRESIQLGHAHSAMAIRIVPLPDPSASSKTPAMPLSASDRYEPYSTGHDLSLRTALPIRGRASRRLQADSHRVCVRGCLSISRSLRSTYASISLSNHRPTQRQAPRLKTLAFRMPLPPSCIQLLPQPNSHQEWLVPPARPSPTSMRPAIHLLRPPRHFSPDHPTLPGTNLRSGQALSLILSTA